MVGLLIAGFAFGFILPTLTTTGAAVAPLALGGWVFGGFCTVMFVGQFASLLLAQPVIAVVSRGGLVGVVGGLLLVLGAVATRAGRRAPVATS